ncbi:hypothetical protein GOBAR_AA08098 [Gossypium barbadense]|uniref:Protein kinase domain-containing protein n=1 Tax=Gossypium barbadense TaxID=3634 RepID=A0A2P5YAC6_GOSBA|nr:hypothetical protein GOBAR_AA08098 [Gossypium barbadense]
MASALFYLHEEGDHYVLHRDIKASNVMLDSSFNTKIGDFGLARLVDHAKGSQTTHLAGTMGYIAPECVSSGKASKESDIYSFGVVALEIACGRMSIEPMCEESQASLVAWVCKLYGNQQILGTVDPKLGMDFDAIQMECLLMVGLWCVHPDQNLRPSIRQVIQVLNFEAPLPKLPSRRPSPTYDVPTTSGIQVSCILCTVWFRSSMSSFNVNGVVRFPTFLASEIVWQIAWLNRVCILPMDCCYLIKCRLSVSHLVRADTEGAAFPRLALFPRMYVQSAPMAYKSTNASITVVADGSNPVGSCLPPPPVAATVVAPPPHASRDTNSVAALITISVFVVLIVISLCICCFCCRRLWRKRQKAIKLDNDDDDKLFGGDFQNGMGPNKFPFMEIDKMTSNFKGEKLGGGGFGAVYRGYVRDLDTLVAVQQIAKASKQGIKEYTSEVKIISRLRHKNLVKLIGWCHKKGELVLVYEFMANGGLDSHLFKGKTLLTLVTIAYYIGISKLATLCGMVVDDWAVVRPSGPEFKTVDKASNSGS